MVDGLPTEATYIDPPLAEVGVDHEHQKLVYGRVQPNNSGALIVAELLQEHPDGVVGKFYGVRLLGFLFGTTFLPYSTEPLGEVRWNDDIREWVQVAAVQA